MSNINTTRTLTLASYLYNGTWVVSATEPLSFAVVCQNSHLRDSILKITPPLGIIQLPASCTGTNDYLSLPAYFYNETRYEISDLYERLKYLHDLSNIALCTPLVNNMSNFTEIDLPTHLKALKDIPMNNLIQELDTLNDITTDNSTSFPNWAFILIGLVICVIMLIILLYLWKYSKKCRLPWSAIKQSNVIASFNNASKSESSDDPEVTASAERNCIQKLGFYQSTNREVSSIV